MTDEKSCKQVHLRHHLHAPIWGDCLFSSVDDTIAGVGGPLTTCVDDCASNNENIKRIIELLHCP
jgi:hypothetical protein